MSRAHRFPLTALVLVATVPLAWLACGGGESKPAESPATESSAAASSEPSGSDMPASSASASASTADTSSATSPSAEATASTPPPPSFGTTDCGQCVDKTCAKPAAACGKNTDCQSTLDGIHSCSSGAACVDSATLPSTAKPKKLATAYQTCAKKALAKACKAKCQ
jgi:hypothetical protein